MIELRDMTCTYCGAALERDEGDIWRCGSCGRYTLVRTTRSSGSIGESFTENYVKYAITSEAAREAEIKRCDPGLSGALKLPTYVRYENIEYTVTSIGRYAFEGCDRFDSIVLPSTLLGIEEGAFARCKLPEEMVLPEGIRRIGVNAFCDTRGLESVIIPDSVEELGKWAFNKSLDLKRVHMGASVRIIDAYAFYGCKSLGRISSDRGSEGLAAVMPESVRYIGFSALDDTKIKALYCHAMAEVGSCNPPRRGSQPSEEVARPAEEARAYTPYGPVSTSPAPELKKRRGLFGRKRWSDAHPI